jgi:hypothetical protein
MLVNEALNWQEKIPEAKEFLKKVDAETKNLRINKDLG